MESKSITQNQKALIILVALIVVTSAAFLFFKPHTSGFCFTFTYSTQFGDKKDLKDPSNEGILGPGGVAYYPIEVKALQTALKNEGLYIDPNEETGGGVYLTTYFGPSTQAAVRAFQNRYDLAETGDVNDVTVDALNRRYACKVSKTATSTPTMVVSTSTVQ